MKTYVIIVTYKGLYNNWIEKCLGSLATSDMPLEVVVVDNASPDDTVSYIKTSHPKVTLIESKENLGFGKANNLGIRKAIEDKADFVFLLNQDAYIFPDTVSKLVAVHKNNPQFGIVSPVHLTGKGEKLDKDFEDFASPLFCKNLFSDVFLGKDIDKLYETSFMNAAAWLISADCLQKVGGFDPIIYHYGEDNNYCHRTIFNQLKIGIYPKSQVLHDRAVNHNPHADPVKSSVRANIVDFLNPLNTRKVNLLEMRLKKYANYVLKNETNYQIFAQSIVFYKANGIQIRSHLEQIRKHEGYLFLKD